MQAACFQAWVTDVTLKRGRRGRAGKSRQSKRLRSRTARTHRQRSTQQQAAAESQRLRRMMVQAAKDVAAKEVQLKARKAQAQRARFLLTCVLRTLKDVAAISRVLRHGDWPQQLLGMFVACGRLFVGERSVGVPLDMAGENQTRITVEYYRPGSVNPGDVHICTALIEGAVEAGTFKSIQSVPCSTPVFSVCGFRLWWNVSARKPACEGDEIECDARLMVSRAEDEGGYGLSRARGFPFVRIELQECGLVWQRCVPTEVQRLTWLAATEFASAQSDAYVNPEEVGNPEGGWEDEDYMFEASWEEEIWDDSGAY